MKRFLSLILFSTLLIIATGCSVEDANDLASFEESNISLFEQLANPSLAKGLPQPPIWASCDLYSGIVAPATFSPKSDSFDELYIMPIDAMNNNPFLNGVPLISDSRPGDRDYNGGRWHLNVLKDGVDPAKYAGACSEEDLDTSDFDSTDMYFECPLRPRKN